MNYFFLNTGAGTGKFNMDFDVALAGACTAEDFFLRLYTWQPYCLSLGANQPDTSVDPVKLQAAGIDLVRRPSGGKAILHAEELTYSVVCHTNTSFTPQQIYREINEALLTGLSIYDERLQFAELENLQPDFRAMFNKDGNFACFGSSAKHELKFDHKKLVGSAQRKMGNVVLQHGSLLCGTYHKRITDFLRYDAATLRVLEQELLDRTIELNTALDAPVDLPRLEISLKAGFEKYSGMKFEDKELSELTEKMHIEEINKL
jgi:lipoate-protein ligase A